MSNVPWSLTPERFLLSRQIDIEILFSARFTASTLSIHGISELNPFNLTAYGPLANCLRLKVAVTCYPPRLATSEWLVLSRRESHPLYVTTLLGRTNRPRGSKK